MSALQNVKDVEAKLNGVVNDVAILETRLSAALDDAKRKDEELERVRREDRRMLLVRRDGSVENAALYAGPDGGPLVRYRRERLLTDYMIYPSPTARQHDAAYCRREDFHLVAQVGRLFVYVEV